MGPMRAIVNTAADPARVPPPSTEAGAFHAGMAGYRPTPVHDLPAVAGELGLGGVGLKDESNRLGLPAFKVLGASWAVERALRERPDVRTLVAASAGNHGRAVAHVAALRGLDARIFLPGRSTPGRREAIAGEGADVVVVDGAYEDAEIVRALREAVPDAPVGGASYWADAAFIAAAGIPTVMFGPGGEGAHAAEEWVSLADTEAVTQALVATARRLCA